MFGIRLPGSGLDHLQVQPTRFQVRFQDPGPTISAPPRKWVCNPPTPKLLSGSYLLEAESSCEGQGWLKPQQNCWAVPRWSLDKGKNEITLRIPWWYPNDTEQRVPEAAGHLLFLPQPHGSLFLADDPYSPPHPSRGRASLSQGSSLHGGPSLPEEVASS